jgi:hypothetical protein
VAKEPVQRVLDVEVWLNKSNPPTIGVRARGQTGSPGYTNPELSVVQYVTPPEDGIQEIQFLATPPQGGVIRPIDEVEAETNLGEPQDWLRGVRVTGADGEEFVVRFAAQSGDKPLQEVQFSDGNTPQIQDDLVFLGIDDPGPYQPYLIAGAGQVCSDITLLSARGVPATKVEMETKCVLSIGGKCRAKIDVPVAYRANTDIKAIARVCYPSGEDILDDIRDCLTQAVAAGVVSGILAGNPAAFVPALKSYLVSCLKSKAVSAARDVEVSLDVRTERGPWRRV